MAESGGGTGESIDRLFKGSSLSLAIHAESAELVQAAMDELVRFYTGQVIESPQNLGLEGGGTRLRITMRSADRLRQDAVDDAEPIQIGRGELQRLGGLGALLAVA